MNNIISFVIRTKNEGDFLEKTCSLIRNSNLLRLKVEIIIVDSGSSDNTLSIAKKYADQILNIPPKDFTWGYALNLGIDVASGDAICLISGHCYIDNSITNIESIYNYLMKSDYACLYGRQIGNIKLDKMEAVELSETYPNIVKDSSRGQIPGISNACCILKKEIWEKYKFDECAQSAEDGIWYKAIVSAGYRAIYYPGMTVIHGHPFDPYYMYRKWYWRIYKSERILNRDKKVMTSNCIRFILAFIKGILYKCLLFYNQAKRIGIDISYISCLKYFFIREYATYRAKIDLKKNRSDNLKYEELKIPVFVKHFFYKIKAGEFYDI